MLRKLILWFLAVGGCGGGGGDSAERENAVAVDPFWTLTRGGADEDGSWTVAVDEEGFVYLVASLADPENMTNVHVYKLTSSGTQLWETTWGGPWTEQAFQAVVSGSYLYVGGQTFHGDQPADGDLFLAKFQTSDGAKVWDFTWDGYGYYDELDGIVVEGDAVYVAGWAENSNRNPDLAVLRLTDHGETVEERWSRKWGDAGDGWWNGWDEGNGQIVVDGQNVYVAGRVNGTSWPLVLGDAALVAFDKEGGEYRWHTTWSNGAWLDDALGMIGDGSFLYLVGMTFNTTDLKSDVFLLKYDVSQGAPSAPVWTRTWGVEGGDLSRSVAIGEDHSVFVAGHTGVRDDSLTEIRTGDAVLLKYTPDGEFVWSKTWGGSGGERIKDVRIRGREVYLAGQTSSAGAGRADALLIKTDIDGVGMR